MEKDLEAECPCVNDCPRHGDCVACTTFHADKEKPSACKRPGVTISKEHAERVQARLQQAGLL